MVGDQVSLTNQVQPIDGGAPGGARRLSRRTRRLWRSPTARYWLTDARWRPIRARRFSAPSATANGCSPVATMAASSRPPRRGRRNRWPRRRASWIDAIATKDGAVAWSAGKLVRVRDAGGTTKSWTAPINRARAGASCPKVSGSRSHTTMAFRCGFRTSLAKLSSSNGKARISTPPSRQTGVFSSPRCRRTHCTAGGSRTPATCA